MYKITDIDTTTNTVQVYFESGEKKLNHTTFVDNITDKDSIVAAVEADYKMFAEEVPDLPENDGNLPKALQALIGKDVATEE